MTEEDPHSMPRPQSVLARDRGRRSGRRASAKSSEPTKIEHWLHHQKDSIANSELALRVVFYLTTVSYGLERRASTIISLFRPFSSLFVSAFGRHQVTCYSG
jgi:hypothetical protein